jgi:hypothetical protein
VSKKFYILFLLAISLFAFNANGQDKLLFLNGKMLEGNLIEKTNYEFTFKTEKEKQFVIDKYRVFSYTQDKKETIVYEFDTLSGNFLKVQDMKMFVYGERDAHQTFKPRITNIIGLGIGAAAGFMMQQDQSFVYIAVPIGFTLTTLLFPTKVNQKRLTDTQYIKEDEYLRGYERIARSKRTQGALKTGLLGLGVGFLVGVLANSSKK